MFVGVGEAEVALLLGLADLTMFQRQHPAASHLLRKSIPDRHQLLVVS